MPPVILKSEGQNQKMKWTENIKVSPHDTDINTVVSASSLIRYMQDAANSQLHNLGPSNEELRADGKAFILSRIICDLYEPAYNYDELTVQTWSREARGFSMSRFHRIMRGNTLIAAAETIWAMVDIKTKQPLRASEFKPNFEPDEKLDINFPARIHFPENECFAKVFEHTVLYSDTDINQHMNNTKYPDLYCNAIDMRGRRPSGISISFLNEAPIGEKLDVYLAEENGYLFFKSIRQDGKINTEAFMKLEEFK